MFDDRSSREILSTAISAGSRDLFAWSGTKNCQFTVRSAYYVALDSSRTVSPQSDMLPFWSEVWKLNVMPKIKIFLWRFGHQSLPTVNNLRKRGMEVNSLCPVCGQKPENHAHLFLSCRWSVNLWKCFLPGMNPSAFVNENVQCWYFRIFSLLSSTDWSLFNILLWFIWKNRNLAVHQSHCWLPSCALWSAKQLSSDFSFAAVLQDSLPPSIGWQKPPKNFIKVNSDAAIFTDHHQIGIGVVLRNYQGAVLECMSNLSAGNSDVIMAEASGLLLGTKMAIEAGYKDVILESDSLILIQELNSHRPSFLSCRNVIQQIKDLSSSFGYCFFVFASRDCNRLAHCLAIQKRNERGRLPRSLDHVALFNMK